MFATGWLFMGVLLLPNGAGADPPLPDDKALYGP